MVVHAYLVVVYGWLFSGLGVGVWWWCNGHLVVYGWWFDGGDVERFHILLRRLQFSACNIIQL